MPASGRFWIDETRGTVLRTEIEYDLETEKSTRSPDAWLPLTYGADTAGAGALGAAPPMAESSAEVAPPPQPSAAPDPEPRPVEMKPAPELPGSTGSLLQKAGDYVVRYEEAFRNVMAVEDSGADRPARGKLVIREEDGAVLRTEVEFRSAGAEDGRSLRVTTVYEPDPALSLLVPAAVTEVCEASVDADLGSAFAARTSSQPTPAGDRLDVTARYSGFHRIATAP